MMDTILNLGLNDEVAEGLVRRPVILISYTIHIAVSYRCTVT